MFWLLPTIYLSAGLFYIMKEKYFNNTKFFTVPNNFNNPCNIEVGTTKYKGEVPTTNNKRNFSSLYYGYYNAMKLILEYNLFTVRDIIKKWSGLPDGANLENYINYIIKDGFVTDNQILNREELLLWLPTIVLRMSGFEQGGDWLKINSDSIAYNICISASNDLT